MSLDIVNNSSILIASFSKLENIAQTLSDKSIELILCDNDSIQEINFQVRNIDKPTDVLSFPLEPFDGHPLGSILISTQMAQKIANELGHSIEDELALLFIHGVLHLLGFDHETDDGEHRKKEEELITLFSLPHSLIVRNS